LANLQRAIEIAVEAHKNQVDKGGRPYILHPLRLMFRMQNDEERMAAVLHDTVEDTPITLDDLRGEGFPDVVVEAVDRLSRRSTESYEEFVARAAEHPLARRVKLADIEDNLDIRRLREIQDRDLVRLRRYHAVWKGLAEPEA